MLLSLLNTAFSWHQNKECLPQLNLFYHSAFLFERLDIVPCSWTTSTLLNLVTNQAERSKCITASFQTQSQ